MLSCIQPGGERNCREGLRRNILWNLKISVEKKYLFNLIIHGIEFIAEHGIKDITPNFQGLRDAIY